MRFNNIAGLVTALVITVAFGLGSSVLADSFLKEVVHSDAFEMMGQKTPAKNDTTTMWLTEGKACSLTGSESAVIFDGKEGVIYTVDYEKKEYSVVPADLFGGGEEDESEDNEMAKMAQAMMGSIEITVTPTDETRKIGDWDCRKYNVDLSMAMMKMTQELWATEDIQVDYTMFQAISGGTMAQMPGYEKVMEAMKQIKGIPVKTVATASMMGSETVTTTELIEYAEKDAPDGIYDIPEGYKKVEMDMGMGGR